MGEEREFRVMGGGEDVVFKKAYSVAPLRLVGRCCLNNDATVSEPKKARVGETGAESRLVPK